MPAMFRSGRGHGPLLRIFISLTRPASESVMSEAVVRHFLLRERSVVDLHEHPEAKNNAATASAIAFNPT